MQKNNNSATWHQAPLSPPKFNPAAYPTSLFSRPGEGAYLFTYSAGVKIAQVGLEFFAGLKGDVKFSALNTKQKGAVTTLLGTEGRRPSADTIVTVLQTTRTLGVPAVTITKVDSISILLEYVPPRTPYQVYVEDYEFYQRKLNGTGAVVDETQSIRRNLRINHDAEQAKRDRLTKTKKAAHPNEAPKTDSKRTLKKLAHKAKMADQKVANEKKATEAKEAKDRREALLKVEKAKHEASVIKLKAQAELRAEEEKAVAAARRRADQLRRADFNVQVEVDTDGWKLVTSKRPTRKSVVTVSGNAATRSNGTTNLTTSRSVSFGTA